MKNVAIFFHVIIMISIIFGCNRFKNPKNVDSTSLESKSEIATDSGLSENQIRFYDLTENLLEKYEAGEIDEVKSDIVELEMLIPSFEYDWNYGNALHKINIAAGRIALGEGRIEEAKMYLISAGKTKGSPQLDSFGPNMTLAKELLEVGETETVIQYFDLCNNFWKLDFGKLRRWKRNVRKGEIPDFGANLNY